MDFTWMRMRGLRQGARGLEHLVIVGGVFEMPPGAFPRF